MSKLKTALNLVVHIGYGVVAVLPIIMEAVEKIGKILAVPH